MVRNYNIFTIYDIMSPYKYVLRIGPKFKAKNKIGNQNQSHFKSIIDLNGRVIIPTTSG